MPLLRSFTPARSAYPILLILILLTTFVTQAATTDLRFEVRIKPGLVSAPQTGRLLLAIARKVDPEPRLTFGATGPEAPFIFGRDADAWSAGQTLVIDDKCIARPIAGLAQLPPGDYFVQVLLMCNTDLLSPHAPGNLHSFPRKMRLDPAHGQSVKLELSSQIPEEELPEETELVKFVKIKSRLLSEFHGRPIYLRAGIILPAGYATDADRKYPLWVRIGGLDSRYDRVLAQMADQSSFRKLWTATNTPRMILLQLDGAGPFGDAYQVDSANNGPYGDAITQELIPFIEEKFHGVGQPRARVLSGVSTGGWASLALQVFYPDFFNGVWSSCPDGLDFRAFELVNIYTDENAYVNKFGFERPSARTAGGDVKLTMRSEVQLENVLGRGDSWTLSGGQWCAWNATYGPRGATGLPVPLWDPQTGKIDHTVAEQWKKYDLRLVLEKNWSTLAPKLRGKLHIAVGEADDYFLNNGVHLLDAFLSKANPPYEGRIAYGPGKTHGWSDVSTAQMMKEMEARTEP